MLLKGLRASGLCEDIMEQSFKFFSDTNRQLFQFFLESLNLDFSVNDMTSIVTVQEPTDEVVFEAETYGAVEV